MEIGDHFERERECYFPSVDCYNTIHWPIVIRVENYIFTESIVLGGRLVSLIYDAAADARRTQDNNELPR